MCYVYRMSCRVCFVGFVVVVVVVVVVVIVVVVVVEASLIKVLTAPPSIPRVFC